MSNLKYSSGNIAAVRDENLPSGGKLHIMGSLFFVSVHKNPGNEVAHDRDSTSYSGSEYSCTRTEKIYGEDAFVHQPVWYDNEDDVSLGNKPCDLMGLDELSDNITSSKFTDDNEYEFLDLTLTWV